MKKCVSYYRILIICLQIWVAIFTRDVVIEGSDAADPSMKSKSTGRRDKKSTPSNAIDNNSNVVELPMTFLEACTEGKIDYITDTLKQKPEYAHGRSPQGETCLHLAGILGQPKVTKLILENGGDPNVRTTFEQGQRMHPLSWNVYGGHVDSARILLQHGADVNLDIDWPTSIRVASGLPKMVPATPLDVIRDILPPPKKSSKKKEDDDDGDKFSKYYEMEKLLLEYGAKSYAEIKQEKEQKQNENPEL